MRAIRMAQRGEVWEDSRVKLPWKRREITEEGLLLSLLRSPLSFVCFHRSASLISSRILCLLRRLLVVIGTLGTRTCIENFIHKSK